MSDKGQLPAGWELPLLADVAGINPGLDRRITSDDTKVTFVPMRVVQTEGHGFSNPESRTYGQVKKGYTPFESGDVIMAKITPCMENGKTTVVPDVDGQVCFGSTEFHVMRPEKGVDPRWIANFLLQHETRRAAQRQMTGGVGQMRVPSSFLETIRIPLPPTNEQARIADALDELTSDLDAGAAALDRVREKLALYRAAVLKAAVEGRLTAEWRAKNGGGESASTLLDRILAERRRRWEEEQLRRFMKKGQEPPRNWRARYKQPLTPVDDRLPLPSGWTWVSCDQLAWASGYGTSVKCSTKDAGIAVLRIPNVAGGRVELAQLKYAPVGYGEDPNELVRPGDLLIVRTNGSRNLIGRGALVQTPLPRPLAFASYLIRLRLPEMPTLWKWLSVVWESALVRRWIEQHAATSAGQYNISLGALQKMTIPLPPPAEQEAILEALGDQLSIVDHLDAELGRQTTAAQMLRQAMLRLAFDGGLAQQNPDDEPAIALLKRIAAGRQQRAQQNVSSRNGFRNTAASTAGGGRSRRKEKTH